MLKTNATRLALALVAISLGAASPASAQNTIYGIGAAGGTPTAVSLFSFQSNAPGTLSALTPVTGIAAGYTLEGIDFRPATGELYGLAYNGTSTAQLYVLNTGTGVATARGATFTIGSIAGSFGNSVGIGFNPSVDRLRVITGTNGNFRVDPTTGALTADTGLGYAAGDRNAANTFQITDGDYTTGAALYDIDYINMSLAQQNPPNNGTLNSATNNLGFTPVNGARSVGFDISQSNVGYLSTAISTDTGFQERLFTVNLGTGVATSLGLIGTNTNFNTLDIAVMIPEPGTWAMLLGGFSLLALMLRRQRGVRVS